MMEKVAGAFETHKIRKNVCDIANYTIRVLLVFIILGLCLQSIFSTSFIGVITREDGSWQQRTLNIADSPLRHAVAFILFTAFLVLLRRGWQRLRRNAVISAMAEKMTVSDMLKILCIFLGAAGSIWILVTQLRPISDPSKVYTIALEWRDKNFSSMAEGGYLFRCPHQAGIVLFYYLLSFFLGADNFVGIQFINLAALLLVYYFLAKLAGCYWKEDKKIQTAVYLGLAVWAPPLFYITYLYGILPGMACSLAAVYMAVQYFETRKYRYMAAGAFCIGIAVVLKENFLVYLIAIVCLLIYDMIVTSSARDRIRSLLFIFLLILGMKGCHLAVDGYVEHLSGHEISQGEAMMSYVSMGLQNGALGPGSYNGYIGDMFVKYHYDTELITEASKTDIKEILKKLTENPLDEGIPFFAGKIAFQWNDPTFSGIFLSKNRSSAITLPDFAQSIIEGEAGVMLSVFLNYVQTWILLGVLCYLLFYWRSKNVYELFGAVIFIGGFLFHCFWEANSSYAIPYYVVIVPYAVKGWLDIARRVDDAIKRGKLCKENTDSKTRIATAAAIACLILLAAFSRTNLFHNTIALNNGAEAEEQFYHRNQETGQELEDGYYAISPYLAEAYVLTEQNENIEITDAENHEIQNISVVAESQKTILRFRGSEKVLAVLPEENDRLTGYLDDAKNLFYDFEQKADDKWLLEAAGGDCYYILMNGQALTYDLEKNRVFLEVYDGNDTQKWVIK